MSEPGQEIETLREQVRCLEAQIDEMEQQNAHTRKQALEEVEKVCTNHLTWLNYLNLGGVNAEKMRTVSTVLDAIRALKQNPD